MAAAYGLLPKKLVAWHNTSDTKTWNKHEANKYIFLKQVFWVNLLPCMGKAQAHVKISLCFFHRGNFSFPVQFDTGH